MRFKVYEVGNSDFNYSALFLTERAAKRTMKKIAKTYLHVVDKIDECGLFFVTDKKGTRHLTFSIDSHIVNLRPLTDKQLGIE